jgi:tRNA A-37 threonylcarbamoyl transferase component Bud32
MGVVYKARQIALKRTVALKMILRGQGGRGDLHRFLAEAEAIAAVKHPNVVHVYEFGEASGQPYISLEYLSGYTLQKRLAEIDRTIDTSLATLRSVTKMVTQITRGVAAAHALGIIHRDLKPGNILFDDADTPKVADFGIAKRDGGSEVTATGIVMGTPAYMSPEQAKGENKFVGPQADVWALGVILYESLTGRRPFISDNHLELMIKIRMEELIPPHRLIQSIPHDLELICLACLAKQPHERYPTAKELADDLDRFSRGEPISVRPVGPVERSYKWVKRNKTISGAVVVVFLALVVCSAISLAFGLEANKQDQEAQTQKRKAEEAAQREKGEATRATAAAERATAGEASALAGQTAARRSLYQMATAEGLRLADANNTTAALVRFAAGIPADPADPAAIPFAATRFAAHERYGCPFRRIAEIRQNGYVRSARLSPDGGTLFVAFDGAVQAWDLTTLDRPRAEWATPGTTPIFTVMVGGWRFKSGLTRHQKTPVCQLAIPTGYTSWIPSRANRSAPISPSPPKLGLCQSVIPDTGSRLPA